MLSGDDMKKLRFIFIITLQLLLIDILCGGAEIPKKKPCKEHPKLSGPCFKVKGRMTFSNGNPSIRIWPVGTNRMLGISEGRFYLEDYENVPEDLVRQLTWNNEMFADFTVCPFTDDELSVMRYICVESAENISVRERK